MLNKSTISALRALVYLAREEGGGCRSPRRIAAALNESPTYLAKSLRYLVKAGILRAEKGVDGGVRLSKLPAEVTLLAVVEACQGAIVEDHCGSSQPAACCCGFHRASLDLHHAIIGAMCRWTLAQLMLERYDGAGHETACLMPGGGLS